MPIILGCLFRPLPRVQPHIIRQLCNLAMINIKRAVASLISHHQRSPGLSHAVTTQLVAMVLLACLLTLRDLTIKMLCLRQANILSLTMAWVPLPTPPIIIRCHILLSTRLMACLPI